MKHSDGSSVGIPTTTRPAPCAIWLSIAGRLVGDRTALAPHDFTPEVLLSSAIVVVSRPRYSAGLRLPAALAGPGTTARPEANHPLELLFAPITQSAPTRSRRD